MLCGCVLQRGNSDDGCELVSTLRKYDLRKGDLFVLSCARVRPIEAEKLLFGADNVCWMCA